MTLLMGVGIIFCWFGMAWAAFNGEWRYLAGYLILQIGFGVVRDALRD